MHTLYRGYFSLGSLQNSPCQTEGNILSHRIICSSGESNIHFFSTYHPYDFATRTWCIQAIPAIYRLVVMSNTTSSLHSTAPGSQNTRKEKVLFYIFHILPEWTTAAILACLNVREMFQTGPSGDYQWRDETREEKEKREEKEREKALKREKRKKLKWGGFK